MHISQIKTRVRTSNVSNSGNFTFSGGIDFLMIPHKNYSKNKSFLNHPTRLQFQILINGIYR
jgi:hypothetical protein